MQDSDITTLYSLCVYWKTNKSVLIFKYDVNTFGIEISAVNSKFEVTFCCEWNKMTVLFVNVDNLNMRSWL